MFLLNFEHQLRSHLSCMFIWRDVRLFPIGACSWPMGWGAGAGHGKSGQWHICTAALGAFSQYFFIKYITLAYKKVKIHAESEENKICLLKKNNHLYQCRKKIPARSPSAVEQTCWLLYHIDLEGASNLSFSPGIQIILVKNQTILNCHCKFLERLKNKQEGNCHEMLLRWPLYMDLLKSPGCKQWGWEEYLLSTHQCALKTALKTLAKP